ncbi:MAG: PaaI family thioesterase [Parvibaculum sp.]|uniref:PaaI family thioesterase n=1 Tax=Parvibaculum sp. TaxID=2024848 RepID=UPI0025DCB9CE|nr:PaaI family thioesterase [Parvibaculum sp.]MCE9649897.1 PaaI family thioesterase [Parvibaculum sp.]
MSETKPATTSTSDLNRFLEAIPYARFMNISVDRKGNEITTVMTFEHKLIGNPVLPALHGGAIGAFLEMTSIIQLAFETGIAAVPKPIGLTIDYLRSGKPLDTYGRAQITKQGRRVATVHAEAWQEDRTRPIAAAHGHFLLKAADETSG